MVDKHNSIFEIANKNTHQYLESEIRAREADIQKLFALCAELERELQACELRSRIEICERDVQHQQDMLKVTSEL